MKTRSLFLAAAFTAVSSALAAQQPAANLAPSDSGITAAAAPAPVAPAGPRVRADIQPVTFSSATAEPVAVHRRATTITLSTIALVLLVVVVVLLVT
jgi:hypothetical protein